MLPPERNRRRRALLSVADKTGLTDLARGLVERDWELLSTGGTLRVLQAAGIPAQPVEASTRFPEILSGRVKTLHPAIHAGLLADRSRPDHLAELERLELAPIDLLVVNLYPFEKAVADPGLDPRAVIEEIDIGGPAMVRAAAKNWRSVAVVLEPERYAEILELLDRHGGALPERYREELALAAFRRTAAYDALIADWFASRLEVAPTLEPKLLLPLARTRTLRYGENPHQNGALYERPGSRGLFGGLEQLQGGDLSYNNLLDADAARRLVGSLAPPAAVIVKHNNPCGVARGASLREALEKAVAADPTSAYGGVVALNAPIDRPVAELLASRFFEVVVAPGCLADARETLAPRTNLRVLLAPAFRSQSPGRLELRSLDGAYLVQTADDEPDAPEGWTVVSDRVPSDADLEALRFAWTVVRGVRSNAIVLARDDQSLGIGAGQMSRVDACRIAIEKSLHPLAGSVAASDAFFPFRDGVDLLAKAGVAAIIQPGGSRRDQEVMAACNEHGIAMVFTRRRHFRH